VEAFTLRIVPQRLGKSVLIRPGAIQFTRMLCLHIRGEVACELHVAALEIA